MTTPVNPSSSQPYPPTTTSTKPTAKQQEQTTSEAGGASHRWGNMTFSGPQWKMLMDNISRMVSNQIKQDDADFKRTMQQDREMWSGG